MRSPTEEELCHERLGVQFATALSDYDTQRRVEILINEFLAPFGLKDKRVLDVGCGLGFFSEHLLYHGAIVTATDIGPTLVQQTRDKLGCDAVVADALNLVDQFGTNAFDIVVSSECIEHTPDPQRAVAQMLQVLKPGGYLSLSTPNLVWSPVVKLATTLRLRPFDGFENFSTFRSLCQVVRDNNSTVVRERGLHLFPFQFKLHRTLRWCDRLQLLRHIMINLCLLAQKSGE